MKSIGLICCFMLVAGIASSNDTTETITIVSEQMLLAPTGLPTSGIAVGGQPNEAAFRSFAEAGYSTVIDMRAADEDRGLVDEPRFIKDLGMTYVAFPIAGSEDISFDKAAALDRLLDGLEGPVLVHCASGNRVGALFALRAKNNGASSDEALAVGKATGMTRLENLVKERLEIR